MTMTSQTRQLFTVIFLFFSLIAGCKNHEQQREQTNPSNPSTPSTSPAPGEATIPRNTGIRQAEAYSDLFFDSSHLDSFISRQKLNDTLSRQFRNFYNHRNFQFAWFAGDGLTEQALAFSSLYNYSRDSSTHRKWLDEQLDSLQKLDTLAPEATDPSILRTELQMTWRFINYLNNRYTNEQERTTALLNFIPVKKQDPLEMARTILSEEKDKTMNPWYDALKSQLQRYMEIAADTSLKLIKKNPRIHLIPELKRHLAKTGYLQNTTDTSARLDDNLKQAILAFQTNHGLKPDGKIQSSLIHELNVPAITRVRQILMNLQRMIWMPSTANEDKNKLILVNIPEFVLHVLENQDRIFDMNIVVGKEGHSTVLFSGMLDRISFNPYWNIPKSIVVKEILPEMQKHKDYLREHDMEITDEKNGIPEIRQLPGEKNELGKMKFLFPNSFNIYLHDSPHKDLFTMTERAYSHGCIRVADAKKLALYLLQPMPDWNEQKIDSVLATSKERTVKLQQPVAVLICYFTCWKGDGQMLEFRKDIYGHDRRLEKMLFKD